jgi:hypothetical protein
MVSFCDHVLSVVREHGTFCNCWDYWPETLYICTPRSYDLADPRFSSIWFWSKTKLNTQKCYDTSTNDWVILKCLSEVYLVRIHDIVPRFLIWPTLEGHRGQSSNRNRLSVRLVTIYVHHTHTVVNILRSLGRQDKKSFHPKFNSDRTEQWIGNSLPQWHLLCQSICRSERCDFSKLQRFPCFWSFFYRFFCRSECSKNIYHLAHRASLIGRSVICDVGMISPP